MTDLREEFEVSYDGVVVDKIRAENPYEALDIAHARLTVWRVCA